MCEICSQRNNSDRGKFVILPKINSVEAKFSFNQEVYDDDQWANLVKVDEITELYIKEATKFFNEVNQINEAPKSGQKTRPQVENEKMI